QRPAGGGRGAAAGGAGRRLAVGGLRPLWHRRLAGEPALRACPGAAAPGAQPAGPAVGPAGRPDRRRRPALAAAGGLEPGQPGLAALAAARTPAGGLSRGTAAARRSLGVTVIIWS